MFNILLTIIINTQLIFIHSISILISDVINYIYKRNIFSFKLPNCLPAYWFYVLFTRKYLSKLLIDLLWPKLMLYNWKLKHRYFRIWKQSFIVSFKYLVNNAQFFKMHKWTEFDGSTTAFVQSTMKFNRICEISLLPSNYA